MGVGILPSEFEFEGGFGKTATNCYIFCKKRCWGSSLEKRFHDPQASKTGETSEKQFITSIRRHGYDRPNANQSRVFSVDIKWQSSLSQQ